MFKPPFILAIAGGGSTYTPGIVKSLMMRLDDFPLAEIRLYDIDEARQNTRLHRWSKRLFAITAHQ